MRRAYQQPQAGGVPARREHNRRAQVRGVLEEGAEAAMEVTYDPGEGTITFMFEKDEQRAWDEQVAPFLAAFKAAVPAHSRTYNPDTKEWTVSDAYETVLLMLAEEAGLQC